MARNIPPYPEPCGELAPEPQEPEAPGPTVPREPPEEPKEEPKAEEGKAEEPAEAPSPVTPPPEPEKPKEEAAPEVPPEPAPPPPAETELDKTEREWRDKIPNVPEDCCDESRLDELKRRVSDLKKRCVEIADEAKYRQKGIRIELEEAKDSAAYRADPWKAQQPYLERIRMWRRIREAAERRFDELNRCLTAHLDPKQCRAEKPEEEACPELEVPDPRIKNLEDKIHASIEQQGNALARCDWTSYRKFNVEYNSLSKKLIELGSVLANKYKKILAEYPSKSNPCGKAAQEALDQTGAAYIEIFERINTHMHTAHLTAERCEEKPAFGPIRPRRRPAPGPR